MEPDELTLKFTWKSQGPRMALNKNKVGRGGLRITHQIVYYTTTETQCVHGTRSENEPMDQNRKLTPWTRSQPLLWQRRPVNQEIRYLGGKWNQTTTSHHMKNQFQVDYRPWWEKKNYISKEVTEKCMDNLEARKASSPWTHESALINFTPQKWRVPGASLVAQW